MLRQIEWGVTNNRPITKNGVLPIQSPCGKINTVFRTLRNKG